MKKIILIALLAAGIFSCKKTSPPAEMYGVVKDMTGLDGCGIMIILDSGLKLEIRGMPLGVMLEKDKRVAVTYKRVQAISICMAGDIVEITSLRYL